MMQQDQIDQKLNQTQFQLNQQELKNEQTHNRLLNPQQQQISNDVSEFNKNQKSIVIHVCNPIEIKKSKLKHYVLYTIQGVDSWGEFQTQRRYKEFYALRKSLIKFWCGYYIPPIPDKIVNPNRDQLRERLKFLNHFVQRISQLEYLYYSVQFAKIFLRSNETKICKTLKGLTPPSLLYQIQVAKQVFSITQENFDQQRLYNSLNNAQIFLHRSQIILNNLSNYIQQMINSNKYLQEKLEQDICTEQQQSEKLILQDSYEDEEGRIKNNEIDQQIKSNLENMIKNRDLHLELINDFIKTEQKDIQAYLEGFYIRENIVQKQDYEQIKLSYWKFEKKENDFICLQDPYRMKYYYDSSNKKIEDHIQKCNKEINKFNHFNLFMLFLSVTVVFDKFKKDKHQNYQKIIKNIAQLELMNLSILQQSWNSIGNLAILERDKNQIFI